MFKSAGAPCGSNPFGKGSINALCPMTCGLCSAGDITQTNGTLAHKTDLNGSATALYTNGADCGRTLRAPAGERVELTFTSFSTEFNFDNVFVYEGNSSGGLRKAKLSGNVVPGAVRTSGQLMHVRFVTDGVVSRPGFAASWQFGPARRGCMEKSALNYDKLARRHAPLPPRTRTCTRMRARVCSFG